MPRKSSVNVEVEWADGTKSEFVAEDHTSIKQRYRQLNLVTIDGDAVAINMANARCVRIESRHVDFEDINETER